MSRAAQAAVPNFEIDVHNVTNAAFLEFVEAGRERVEITGAMLVCTARRVLQTEDPVVHLPLSLEELPA